MGMGTGMEVGMGMGTEVGTEVGTGMAEIMTVHLNNFNKCSFSPTNSMLKNTVSGISS